MVFRIFKKTMNPLILGLAVLLFSFTVNAGQALLQYKYNQDEESVYRHIFKVNSISSTGQLLVETNLEVTSEVLQNVGVVDDRQMTYGITLRQAVVDEYYRGIKVLGEDNPTKISFKDELQKKLWSLIGEELGHYTINLQGELLNSDITENTRAISQINMGVIGNLLAIHLPNTPVGIGSTWSEIQEFSLPQVGRSEPFQTMVSFEIVDRVELEGYDCFQIRATLYMEERLPLDDEEHGQSYVDFVHTGLSYVYFAHQEGRLIRSVTSQNLVVTVFLAAEGNKPEVISDLRTEKDEIITYIP